MLIVDDEKPLRDMLQRALLFEGFNAVVATGGAAGLDLLLHDRSIGLVLLDLNMPEVDGWAFRRRQLADRRAAAIPTIVVTGVRDAQLRTEELQAAAYLRKPFTREQLIAAVARFVVPGSV